MQLLSNPIILFVPTESHVRQLLRIKGAEHVKQL